MAWSYKDGEWPSQNHMLVNSFSLAGDWGWSGDKKFGCALSADASYAFTIHAIIPVADGWQLIYSLKTSWDKSDLFSLRVSSDGMAQQPQTLITGMRQDGVHVVSNDSQAYIFYIAKKTSDDETPADALMGGLHVFAINLMP